MVYQGIELNIDPHLLELYNSTWLGPLNDSDIKAIVEIVGLNADKIVEMTEKYMRDQLEMNGYLKKVVHSCGYKGNLDMLIKVPDSPMDETEIRYRLFGANNTVKQIPIDSYPPIMQPFIEKWRKVCPRVKPEEFDGLWLKLNAYYKGSYFCIDPFCLGCKLSQFAQRIKEMEAELLDLGLAVRIDEYN